jgi:condensin complex subunit 3
LHSEVRRVALLQLDPQPETMPYIIRRARDVDPVTRRAVFAVSLAELPEPFITITLEQREQLIRAGLKDREPNVRKAAVKLVSSWAEQAGGLVQVRASRT